MSRMKIVRSIGVFLLGIVFFLNCVLLYVSGTTQALFSLNGSNSIIENIDLTKPLDNALQNMLGNHPLKANIRKQVQQIEETIKNSNDFKKFVHIYTMDIIDSMANTNAPARDIDKDMRAIIDTYKDELKMSLGTLMSEPQKDALILKLKENLNVKGVYNHAVDYARGYVTPQQVAIIKVVNFFSKSYASLLIYGLMGINVIAIGILKRSFFKSLLVIGIVLVCVAGLLFVSSGLIGHMLSDVPSMAKEIVSLESQRMKLYAYWYFGVGIVLFIVYSVRSMVYNAHKN